MNHTTELIEHISNEITTLMTTLMTFRARLSFIFLVGPFALLGSFLIITKGDISAIILGGDALYYLLVASIAYIAVGYIWSQMDSHVTEHCDRLRIQLVELATDDKVKIDKILFPHKTMAVYMSLYALTFIAFLAMAMFLRLLLLAA